jgi:CYTH domain-containing protein
MTYKGKGLMAREEYNLPLNKEAYYHLREKADGNIISKKRYVIPIEQTDLCVELDVFDEPFAPLIIAEVEFPDEETAETFQMLDWFSQDVTNDPAYHNSNLSKKQI